MKVFVTGPGGYIGGSVAARLVEAGHAVRGLVRSPERADAVRRFGIEPVLGSLDDGGLLAAEAGQADAVVNAASSDHRGAVEAFVGALAGSGKALLHTSGSSIVGDDARGEFSEAVFEEDTPVAPTGGRAARVAIDRFVVGAAERGVRSAVLCNTLIYGPASDRTRTASRYRPWCGRRCGAACRGMSGAGSTSGPPSTSTTWPSCTGSCWRTRRRAASCSWRTGKRRSATWWARSAAGSASASRRPGRSRTRSGNGVPTAPPMRSARTAGCGAVARGRFGWAPRHASVLDWIAREMPVGGG